MFTDVACAGCACTTLVDHVMGCPRIGILTIGGFCKYHEPLCARRQLLVSNRGPVPLTALEEWKFNGVTLESPSLLQGEIRQAIARVQAHFPSLRLETDFSFRDSCGNFNDPLKQPPQLSTAKIPWEPEEGRSWAHHVLKLFPDDASPYWNQWKHAGIFDESIQLQYQSYKTSAKGSPHVLCNSNITCARSHR